MKGGQNSLSKITKCKNRTSRKFHQSKLKWLHISEGQFFVNPNLHE